MIVEILIGAGIIAAGAAAARVITRRRAANAERARTPEAPEPPRGPRGLRVGDVLLYADSELWLAGCVELDEEGLVARLFPTPGSPRAEFVVQLDPDARDLVVARACDEVPDGPVPESLPIGGRRLALERRGHAAARSEGEHLPRTTERASYTILSDVGGRVLVVADFVKGRRLALVGDRVSEHMIDLLPGGDLESR